MIEGNSLISPEQYFRQQYYSSRRAVPVWPLALLITSFFYCLPLGRYSLGQFSSDFRVFDFAILFVAFFYLSKETVTHEVNRLFKSQQWFVYWLKILAIAVLISLLVGILYSGTSFLLPMIIRIYRFIAYLMVPFLVFAVIRTKQDFVYFFLLYFWLSAAVGILAFLQGLGFLPNFWPEIWQAMYSQNTAAVATLSPHHKHIGIIMLVGVCLGMGYVLTARSLMTKMIVAFAALLMFTVPLFAGTRTYLLGFVGVIPALILIGKGRGLIPVLLMVIGALVFLQYSGGSVTAKIEEKLDERVTARVEKLGYEGLYRERTLIYEDAFLAITNKPYLLMTGTGFQNIQRFVGANGAHNNFLHVLMELGIIGLIIFISFLTALWRNIKRASRDIPDSDIRTIASYAWVALCGILLTMLVGETFWGQAAMFTLAGQLSFLFGLVISPLYWRHRHYQTYYRLYAPK